MKEKRYIILEVECEVEEETVYFEDGTVFDTEIYLKDSEWQKLHALKDLLYGFENRWVTNVSSFKKEVK